MKCIEEKIEAYNQIIEADKIERDILIMINDKLSELDNIMEYFSKNKKLKICPKIYLELSIPTDDYSNTKKTVALKVTLGGKSIYYIMITKFDDGNYWVPYCHYYFDEHFWSTYELTSELLKDAYNMILIYKIIK